MYFQVISADSFFVDLSYIPRMGEMIQLCLVTGVAIHLHMLSNFSVMCKEPFVGI